METCKNFKALFKNQLHSSPMFLKLLNEDFSSYLIISKENLGKAQQAFANREVITLIGPNGKYDIGTKMSREGVILEKGWAEFSRAHHLCNTDKLIFACGCHGLFFALIFDKNGKLVGRRFGPSEAEEDGIIPEHDNINDKEAQSQGKKEKVVASSSRLPGKRKGTSKQCEPPPARPKLISISSDSSINNDAGKGQASGAKKPCEKREISDTSDSSDSETSGPQIIAKLRKTFVSGRRPVTDVEVEKTLRAAQGFQSSRPYFLKQMKSNNVYREFSFIVPIKFARANLPDHATQISLRVPGKTDEWEVNCKVRVQNAGTQLVWIIMGGWSKFSLANNLEEGDTLVFEMTKKDLTKKKNQKIKMDVHIFRVVKEIKPLKVL